MDFALTADQRDLLAPIETIARAEFAETAFDHNAATPQQNIRRLASLGLLALSLPVDYGGAGRPAVDAVLAVEKIAQSCPRTAWYFLNVNLGPAYVLAQLASPEICERYVGPSALGDLMIRIAITEPDAGSDVAAMRTTARPDGDVVVLNGSKVFTSGSDHAHAFLTYVRFGEAPDDIGCVLVDRDAPGLGFGSPETYMDGERYLPLFFEDCRVPAENVIAAGGAFKLLMGAYNVARCGAAAEALGVAQLAHDLALDYILERRQFNRRLADFQGLRWMIAEMATEIEGARLLCYRAISDLHDGFPRRYESSMAKLAAAEAVKSVVDKALQLHGGSGYVNSVPISWLYRLGRRFSLAGGTSEIHKNGLAAELIRRREAQRATR